MKLSCLINGQPANLDIPDTEIQRIAGVRVFVDKKGLAEKINKSVSTIERWMRQKLIPYMKQGGAVIFDLVEVQEHLRRHRTVKSILR